ncbi:MAG: hypothetical protein HY829_10530 [Actinobacteria bacterium]|nr:hypothetical protein [Actinomycetota bacterium]
MAVSYTASTFNTAGTAGGGVLYYKEVTVTAAVGDMIVAYGVNESASSGTSTVTTSGGTGATGAWTTIFESHVASSCGFMSARATVTTAGTVTVRVSVAGGSAGRMGVAVWLIPAAEWTGTPATATMGPADADGQVSLIVGASSNVMYAGADWNALNPGTTTTPAGGTADTSYFDTTNYAAFGAHWGTQAAGTRNYGPASLTSRSYTGMAIAVPVASGAATVNGAAALSQSSTLTSDTLVTDVAAASLTSGSTLTAGAVVTQAAAAALTSSSTLTVAGIVTQPAAAALAQSSTLTAGAVDTVPVAAALSASSTLTVAALDTVPAAAALSQTSILTASTGGTAAGSASLSQSSTLTVAGVVTRLGVATLSQSSTLTVAAVATASGTTALVQLATLTVAAVVTRFGTVVLVQASTLVAGASSGGSRPPTPNPGLILTTPVLWTVLAAPQPGLLLTTPTLGLELS